MVWEHCGPTTISRADTHRVMELAKKEGLQLYKERRVCIASSKACFASSELPTQKAPSVQSDSTAASQILSFWRGVTGHGTGSAIWVRGRSCISESQQPLGGSWLLQGSAGVSQFFDEAANLKDCTA